MRNNVYSDTFWYGDMFLPVWAKSEKLWGDDIINSLIWIFIRTGQEMFSEKIWNFKMSYLPYFSSNFHNLFTVL